MLSLLPNCPISTSNVPCQIIAAGIECQEAWEMQMMSTSCSAILYRFLNLLIDLLRERKKKKKGGGEGTGTVFCTYSCHSMANADDPGLKRNTMRNN